MLFKEQEWKSSVQVLILCDSVCFLNVDLVVLYFNKKINLDNMEFWFKSYTEDVKTVKMIDVM